ncbi:hypothetical protein FB451DRAFT_1529132 [Mycena latifolia]|nr:hypothetical protein FB451DRAFT_1529132 [Mycena latifolia]
MPRDGLNLYGVVCVVNVVNLHFWFIINPTDEADPTRTIVTSMTAVLTTSNTLRIVLVIRGRLARGGSFAPPGLADTSKSSRATHILATRPGLPTLTLTHMIDTMRGKSESAWGAENDKDMLSVSELTRESRIGVKVTIDREVGYDSCNE